jgi:hypothetical protein
VLASRRSLVRLIPIVIAIALLLYLRRPASAPVGASLAEAFRGHRSDVVVQTAGRVIKLLPDDRNGSRHQRFLFQSEGITVLVAHNLDVAPRVPLAPGDSIQLSGQYEWNEKGGVIHWTHRDPGGGHPPGWIRWRDSLFQ